MLRTAITFRLAETLKPHFGVALIGTLSSIALLVGPSSPDSLYQAPEEQGVALVQQKNDLTDDQARTIRVVARLVEVNVVVLDRSGKPLANLTQSDFELRESGRLQQLSVFQSHSLDGLGVEPLPQGMVTNRLDMKGVPAGVISVILLDGINTGFGDRAIARAQVLRFLEQIRPQDRIAVVTLQRDYIRVLHDFTDDIGALVRALARVGQHADGELQAAGPDPIMQAGFDMMTGFDEWLDAATESMQASNAAAYRFFMERRIRATGAGLEALANKLARFPGRKNLIWVSAGFPLQMGSVALPGRTADWRSQADFAPLLKNALRALNNAGVAVYPVDARGLVGPFDPALGDAEGPVTQRQVLNPSSAYSRLPIVSLSATHDSMVRLAQATGGRHFINTNDIAGAIRTAIDESRVTYTLGYYPTHGKWDGSYREIQVKVKRPGVTIRHRRGYYAFPDPPATPETIEEAMLAAAVSPLDATAIGLTAQMTPHAASAPGEPREGAAGQRVTLTIEPEDVPLRLEDGRRKATLDVWYVLLDEEGAPHSIAKYPVEIALDEAGWRAAQATGIREERYMEFPAEARALRIVVRDRVTGVLGSLRMPLPQPN